MVSLESLPCSGMSVMITTYTDEVKYLSHCSFSEDPHVVSLLLVVKVLFEHQSAFTIFM